MEEIWKIWIVYPQESQEKKNLGIFKGTECEAKDWLVKTAHSCGGCFCVEYNAENSFVKWGRVCAFVEQDFKTKEIKFGYEEAFLSKISDIDSII